MSIINIVIDVKKIKKDTIILVKIGKFYYCYGKDSYIISYLTNYKINLLENNVYSCAFSTSACNKVISILDEKKINYAILDRRNNYDELEQQNIKNLNKYVFYYEKAKQVIGSKLKIEKIYKYLHENLKDNELIKNVEECIRKYERRKI